MKKQIKLILTAVCASFLTLLASCSKAPERGYVSSEYITDEIVSKIEDKSLYTKYNATGSFNFKGYEVLDFPAELNITNFKFKDSTHFYDLACRSHYLELPLHITNKNWMCYYSEGSIDNRVKGAKVVLVRKGMKPSLTDNSILAETYALKLKGKELVFPITSLEDSRNKPRPKSEKLNIDATMLQYNLAAGEVMPNTDFDAYFYGFDINNSSRLIKIEDKASEAMVAKKDLVVTLDEKILGGRILLVEKDATPELGSASILAETTTITKDKTGKLAFINDEKPSASEKAKPEMLDKYYFDTSAIELNMKDGMKLPNEEYDTYLYAWGSNLDPSFITLNQGKLNSNKSTMLRAQGKMYQANNAYNDTYYYYKRPDGGFFIKSFGVNKKITLKVRKNNKEYDRAIIKGKLNIVAEYDKDGYLVYESFETINSKKDPATNTSYGSASYTYAK